MKPRPMMNRRAFSLIELLVVIAIIGVLLAIAMPVLGSVRNKARTALCMTRSRQIAVAINAFAGERGGRLPENRKLVAPGEHVTWRHTFAEAGFIPTSDTWTCPNHPGEPGSEIGQWDRDTVCVGDIASSYAINGHVLWRGETSEKDALRPDTAIDRPSHTILVAESRARFPDIRVTNVIIATDDEIGGMFSWWHNGDGVYGFQDGHVETIALLDTGSPDCRWHNGPDLSADPFDEQDPAERRSHDHPDWEYLVDDVYRR